MAPYNRQDEHKLIHALLTDIHMSHEVVFNTRSLRLTLNKVNDRLRTEGLGFLTKTLPRLGKALDRALSSNTKLSASSVGFSSPAGSELPRFLGEFFSLVFDPTGTVLQSPCAESVRVLRQVLYLFYKYELPYSEAQEQKVIASFVKTEQDLLDLSPKFLELQTLTDQDTHLRRHRHKSKTQVDVVREARILLSKVFRDFDFTDIVPRHGPGAVATKQQLWEKYRFTNVSSRIRKHYPLDAYFYASLGHVCDRLDSLSAINDEDLPARVILVPKDSRGPRLISCEPVDFQWVQQGISRRLVQHIEELYLTRYNVFFTDQTPNQCGALLGSRTGRYATLDLKEASDRVSCGLVRLLFPPHVSEVLLESARSTSTELPSGKIIKLEKFAPMGSALCFPIMALTIWSILTAAAPDADTQERILVYGDDVVVPKAYALNATEQLESFGLKINRDKCCTEGLFRESCGKDAFNGESVTPVRLRTVWSTSPSPEVYASWISYANSFHSRKYFNTYDLIVGMLFRTYGAIPCTDMHLQCPALVEVPEVMRPRRKRTNHKLQKSEWYVRDIKAPAKIHEMDGWLMLLRFFTESRASVRQHPSVNSSHEGADFAPFSVRSYTSRRTSMLVRRWR